MYSGLKRSLDVLLSHFKQSVFIIHQYRMGAVWLMCVTEEGNKMDFATCFKFVYKTDVKTVTSRKSINGFFFFGVGSFLQFSFFHNIPSSTDP